MTFAEAIKSCYQKYATLSGRASRSEFWYFNLLFYAPLLILYLGFEYGPLSDDFYLTATGIFVLANFLPMLAVSVRRLHDVNMSGWWLLIRIVPLLGDLYLLVKFCTKGDVGQNRYGVSAETRAVDQKEDLTEQYTHKMQGDIYLECISGQYKGAKFELGSAFDFYIGTDPKKCAIVVDTKRHYDISPRHCRILSDFLGHGGVFPIALYFESQVGSLLVGGTDKRRGSPNIGSGIGSGGCRFKAAGGDGTEEVSIFPNDFEKPVRLVLGDMEFVIGCN